MDFKLSRDEVLARHRLTDYLDSIGAKLRGEGNSKVTNSCPCGDHDKGHCPVTVNCARQIWHCNDDSKGGSIVDWLAIVRKTSPEIVFKELAESCERGLPGPVARSGAFSGPGSIKTAPVPSKPVLEPSKAIGKEVCTYDYQDANGNLVYQVVRYEPKSFRQRHKSESGSWIWNMDGVERVLYRLPEVIKSQSIWIVEGEKDSENLALLGLVATCNVGGAGKWLDSYTEFLAGKDVIICGDTDQPGKEHVDLVAKSIAGTAKTVKIVRLVTGKDVSEFLATFSDKTNARKALDDMVEAAPTLIKGFDLPIFSVPEMERKYQRFLKDVAHCQFHLGSWLPTLGQHTQGLVPGDVVVVLAQTGVGKTHVLSNVAFHAHPLPTLFFEMELPDAKMYERILSTSTRWSKDTIKEAYASGDSLGEAGLSRLNHLHFCTDPKLTPEKLEQYITRSELKIGCRPKVVCVDYIQLMQGMGNSRYEKASNVAEEIKIIAKATGTILIVASQVSRKPEDEKEVYLTDGKDSGSIENSAGLLLGMWRDEADKLKLYLKILKNSEGTSGIVVPCMFQGAVPGRFSPRIVEIAPQKISDADVPR